MELYIYKHLFFTNRLEKTHRFTDAERMTHEDIFFLNNLGKRVSNVPTLLRKFQLEQLKLNKAYTSTTIRRNVQTCAENFLDESAKNDMNRLAIKLKFLIIPYLR